MSAEILHLRPITARPKALLQGAQLDRYLDLMGEKHSRLVAAWAARARGDRDRLELHWLQVRAINKQIAEIESRRPAI